MHVITNGLARHRTVVCDCKRFNPPESNSDMQLTIIGIFPSPSQITFWSYTTVSHPHNKWIAWNLPRKYVLSSILPWPYWPYSFMRSVDRNVSFYPIIAVLILWLWSPWLLSPWPGFGAHFTKMIFHSQVKLYENLVMLCISFWSLSQQICAHSMTVELLSYHGHNFVAIISLEFG